MTKITLEIYVDHGVVTRVLKATDANFQEPEFVVDTMFQEVSEEGSYDRDTLSTVTYWPIVDGEAVRLSLTTRKEGQSL